MAHSSSADSASEAGAEACGGEGLEGTVMKLRATVADRLQRHLVSSAVFLADKLVSMSGGAECDVYALADAHFRSGAERRAEKLLRKHGLLVSVRAAGPPESLRCQYLGARCLSVLNEWDECLGALIYVLGDDPDGAAEGGTAALCLPNRPPFNTLHGDSAAACDARRTLACMCLLRGAAHEKKEQRRVAAQWYARALQLDVLCSEAFDALVGHQLLKAAEQHFLWENLLAPRLGPDDAWLATLYREQLLVYEAAPEPLPVPAAIATAARPDAAPLECWGLAQNLDVRMIHAERLFESHDTAGAHALTSGVLRADPHMQRGLVAHICTLVELGRKADLFKLSHELVDERPEDATSWFAVGCYYKASGKVPRTADGIPPVRKFFDKATRKDPDFAPGWIGYGNYFADQDESEQALAAYRQAQRLYVGCHIPTLYIGMEYLRTNHLDLAEQHLSMCVGDGRIRCRSARARSSSSLVARRSVPTLPLSLFFSRSLSRTRTRAERPTHPPPPNAERRTPNAARNQFARQTRSC